MGCISAAQCLKQEPVGCRQRALLQQQPGIALQQVGKIRELSKTVTVNGLSILNASGRLQGISGFKVDICSITVSGYSFPQQWEQKICGRCVFPLLIILGA